MGGRSTREGLSPGGSATAPAASGTSRPSPSRAGRLRVLSVQDARCALDREFLLDGLMAVGETSLWWGVPKKSAKSFLMLRLSYGLACGLGMWGLDASQTAVLYVAAEGQRGIGGRIVALANELGDTAWFRYVAQSVDLLDPGADADTESLVQAGTALLEAIETATGTRPPLLIVVDTYHRAAPGAEENSARDAGRFIANVDLLRERTGAHVAVIHHGADRPRGSTAIDGAVDVLVHIEPVKGGCRRATVAGAKDDESGGAFVFHLRPVALPAGAARRGRTTCVAVAGPAPPPPGAATGASPDGDELSPDDRELLEGIQALFAEPGAAVERVQPRAGMRPVRAVPRAALRDLRRRFSRLDGTGGTPPRGERRRLSDNDRQAMQRALRRLQGAGTIGVTAEWVWLVPDANARSTDEA